MNIKLWYCESMGLWRWTLTDGRRPVCRQESGQREDLRLAMEDVAKTVEYMLQLRDTGDQRSGSAAALHAVGHWFESDIAHYK